MLIRDSNGTLRIPQGIPPRGPAYSSVDVIPIFPQKRVPAAAYSIEQYAASTHRGEPQIYQQRHEVSYPVIQTPIAQASSPAEIPEWHIKEYDPDVDRTLIEHSLAALFGDKAMNNGTADIVSTDDWVDPATDSTKLEPELDGILDNALDDSTADHINEMDLTSDSLLDTVLDDASVEELSEYGQSLDDILNNATDDDIALEDIADILGEPMEYDMPHEEMPEEDPDMDSMEDPMEISPYMV